MKMQNIVLVLVIYTTYKISLFLVTPQCSSAFYNVIIFNIFLFLQAPENELRKVNVNGGERILSEHELRIQRSLQRLNLPEWYKTSNVPAQGFLLKRNSDAGYTTSMSSLSSNQSHSPKTYTNYSKQYKTLCINCLQI